MSDSYTVTHFPHVLADILVVWEHFLKHVWFRPQLLFHFRTVREDQDTSSTSTSYPEQIIIILWATNAHPHFPVSLYIAKTRDPGHR